MTELKPCPFCGSKDIYEYIPSAYELGEDAEIYCKNPICGATISGNDIEIVRAKWNRRVNE